MKPLAMILMFCLAAAAHANAESAQLNTPTGVLYGTIEFPDGPGPFTIAIIHAGSGPTDRDGNSPLLQGKNDSLKMLAQGLAARGIATLRVDKRGIAESAKAGPKEQDLRFETYIDDLVAWGKQVRTDKRFRKLIAVGHSEGALIATVAAGKLPADALVSIAGAGKPMDRIILDQIGDRAPADIRAQTADILASLKQGHTVETVPQQLLALFRPSVQPYLISTFKYEPMKEIAKLNMPVLILQGTTDIQVTVNDARLLSASKPSAKLVIVDGMNHVLKSISSTDPLAQLGTYSNPDLPLVPQVVEEIVQFANRK